MDYMKCVKNGSDVRRVSDEKADLMVRERGDWKYCPKSEWKKTSRTPAPIPAKEGKESKEVKEDPKEVKERGKKLRREKKAKKEAKAASDLATEVKA